MIDYEIPNRDTPHSSSFDSSNKSDVLSDMSVNRHIFDVSIVTATVRTVRYSLKTVLLKRLQNRIKF